MQRNILNAVNEAREALRSVVLATDLASGEQALIENGTVTTGTLDVGAQAFEAVPDVLRLDTGRVVETKGKRIFLQVFNPPLRLIVIGAVHIAQPLAQMAVLAGYGVTIVDPRSAFATKERFPGMVLNHEWPDDAVVELEPDARTAVVSLSHDPKLDDPGLRVALGRPCFYIAALGSRKTHTARLERLGALGVSDSDLARIHGPAGLALSAKSPAEIALSIMAQMTQVLRAPQDRQTIKKVA